MSNINGPRDPRKPSKLEREIDTKIQWIYDNFGGRDSLKNFHDAYLKELEAKRAAD